MPPLLSKLAAHNGLVCIGGVKLAALDRISYMPTTTSTDNKGRLKLGSARANLPIGLSVCVSACRQHRRLNCIRQMAPLLVMIQHLVYLL